MPGPKMEFEVSVYFQSGQALHIPISDKSEGVRLVHKVAESSDFVMVSNDNFGPVIINPAHVSFCDLHVKGKGRKC